jgi:hypothetical protein
MAAIGVAPKALGSRRNEEVPGYALHRLCATVTLGLLVLLVTPTPAHAWWDFIEEFSGPKYFYGWDIQLRLICFRQVTTTDSTTKSEEVRTKGELNTKSGILLSMCRPADDITRGTVKTQYKPRAAFDLGARFVWSDHNPHLAQGQRISLTILEPAVSIPLTSQYDRWDILDYGFGAGVYWFSSEGFPSFNGAFLEPLRLDVRLPVKNPRVKSIIFRYGLLVFPGGFEADRFNPDPGFGERISRDWVHSLGIFVDVAQLFSRDASGARRSY